MVLAPWIRLVVACLCALWLGWDIGGWALRAVLAVMVVLWGAWAVVSTIEER